ncbi:hypothetical protein EXE44_05090 [Halorubrum sp. SS7]|uniref:hypothetical protein n=1 Tax=unclassified Halorubrum TaxID=2642239 RepID=UPI0010F69A2B|nr:MULTISPECIES: hypothetical protein [unclassified Halorubrum]TKX52866.1 hypothetical protein EXE42_15160 [Halorubrum sp. SP3]TKX58923.1 hypothetical protein EXE44_05090 [Halorubrum sp. SS7]
MSDTIPVVHEADALDEAYKLGWENFEASPEAIEDPTEAVSHFKESAHYANNTAPTLRCMAGFRDHVGGTYQDPPETVAVVPVGDAEDRPIQAEQMDPRQVLDAIHDAYHAGAYDALEGREYGATDDVTLTN